MNQDEEHLKLLSIFHYVVAGLSALFACFPIFHLVIGIGMVIGSLVDPSRDSIPLAGVGLIFTIFAGGIMLFGWVFAASVAFAGRFLMTRKRYMFCLVVAGIECIFTPFGTILGVFTIIVLMRPSVKELFGVGQTAEAIT